jgi:hypothetical protein
MHHHYKDFIGYFYVTYVAYLMDDNKSTFVILLLGIEANVIFFCTIRTCKF